MHIQDQDRLTAKKIKERFEDVINGCVAFYNNEFNSTTYEGREALKEMYDDLIDLTKHYKINMSNAKSLDNET